MRFTSVAAAAGPSDDLDLASLRGSSLKLMRIFDSFFILVHPKFEF